MNAKREIGYDFIRFIAMLLIVVFHFYSTCAEKGYRFPSLLKHVIVHGSIGWGGVGVALFFMLSGAVLMMTNKDKSILYFYKKD